MRYHNARSTVFREASPNTSTSGGYILAGSAVFSTNGPVDGHLSDPYTMPQEIHQVDREGVRIDVASLSECRRMQQMGSFEARIISAIAGSL